MPPLRARVHDVPLLVDHFVRKFAAANRKDVSGVTEAALEALAAHTWPGNVRELEHAVERAVILSRGPRLDLDLFPMLPRPAAGPARGSDGPVIPGSSLEEIEREAIHRTLESVGGSTSRAAAILKISARTIQYKMKQYRTRGTVSRRD